MGTKTVTREVEIPICDICGAEIDEEDLDETNTCIKCGKEVCNKHIGDTASIECVGICTICSEKYHFEEEIDDEDGCERDILVSNRSQREVKAPFW